MASFVLHQVLDQEPHDFNLLGGYESIKGLEIDVQKDLASERVLQNLVQPGPVLLVDGQTEALAEQICEVFSGPGSFGQTQCLERLDTFFVESEGLGAVELHNFKLTTAWLVFGNKLRL